MAWDELFGQTRRTFLKAAIPVGVLSSTSRTTAQAQINAEINNIEVYADRVTYDDTVPADVTLRNTGATEADFYVDYNVVAPGEDDPFPRRVDGEDGAETTLAPGDEATVTVEWEVDDDASTGSYDIYVAVYDQSAQSDITVPLDEATIRNAFELRESGSEIDATINEFETDGGDVVVGETVESTVTVENTGDVEHTFYVGYSMYAHADGEAYSEGVTGASVTLEPGEQETVTVSWTAPEDAPTGPYDAVTAVWEESSFDDLETQLDRAENEAAVYVEGTEVELTAAFDIVTDNPIVGEEVEFDASDSEAPDGTIEEYRWDVTGDDEVDLTGEVVTTEFDEASDYEVTLIVVDSEGNKDTVQKTVTVDPPETSFRFRALVPPVFPIPEDTLTAGALLESEQSHDTPATARLSFDDEQVAEKSVSVVEGLTPIHWWADVSLTPGSHDLLATVEAEWLDGTIEATRTVDVPPLALTEVYTQPAVHRSDSGDDTDKKMTETVLEVENPTEETVTATFSLYTAERNGSTDDPELQGDPDERQEVTVNAGGTTRLYFLWELDSEATHQIEITMDISDDSLYLYRDAYSPLGIPMPTEIAYSAGTAPRGSGHSIQIAELVYHKDFVVAHDRSAVYVPMTGDGRNEIVIYDEDENVLGQTEQSVDTTVQGPVMEMIDPLDPNEWIEVPLEVDDSTQFLIVHIKEEKNVLWAIGKGFLSSPLAFARALDGLVPGESPKEEHGGTKNADPNALRYEHMAVAELSGYPESPDLQEFSQEVGDQEAAEYHWETVEQALTELPTVVDGFKSVTAEVISTFVSVVEGVAKETMDEITDAFGVHVSFSELAAYNDEELGKLTVYDYGTDDPGIGADREKLSHVRTVILKRPATS